MRERKGRTASAPGPTAFQTRPCVSLVQRRSKVGKRYDRQRTQSSMSQPMPASARCRRRRTREPPRARSQDPDVLRLGPEQLRLQAGHGYLYDVGHVPLGDRYEQHQQGNRAATAAVSCHDRRRNEAERGDDDQNRRHHRTTRSTRRLPQSSRRERERRVALVRCRSTSVGAHLSGVIDRDPGHFKAQVTSVLCPSAAPRNPHAPGGSRSAYPRAGTSDPALLRVAVRCRSAP